MLTRRQLSGARGQLARASEIATVLSASGFHWLVAAAGLRACVSLRCRAHCALGFEQCPHHVEMDLPLPDRMRRVLERLGPTFVKSGQMLALRPDYVPLPYAEALRALHAQAAPFPGREAEAIVARELGAPLARSFADFEAEPFAAASLSQVHRARLPDGRLVAVKVQRPGIPVQIERDLALLALLARRLERRRPQALGFRPSAAVAELADHTHRELDFRREGRAAERMRRLFAADDRLVVPAVDWERTTARVLTTELVEGHSPAPAAELERAGLDATALLGAGAELVLAQIFRYGFFHADPHPGNVLLLEGDRVCFLDYGMVGQLAQRERRAAALMFWGLIEGDYESVSQRLLRISTLQPGASRSAFTAAVADTVEDWYGRPPGEYSIARLLLAVLGQGAATGIVFPRSLMLLARALVNLEATASVISPAVTLAELAQPLAPQLRRWLLLDREALDEAWRHGRADLVELAYELPGLVHGLAMRGDDRATPAGPAPVRATGAGPALIAGLSIGAAAGRLAGHRRGGRRRS